jgi:hypothetical protein
MARAARRSKQKNCRGCGAEFTQVFNREYCSPECHKRHWHKATNAKRKAITAEQVITKVCGHCSTEFSYKNASGKNGKKYCSFQCQRKAAMKLFNDRKATRGTCTVDGCAKQIDRVSVGMCEMHFGRYYRKGTTDKVKHPGRYTTSVGYVLVRNPEHPLATSNGHLGEHRLVAHEKHGGVCPPCHWCSKPLVWDKAAVDHLNEVKDDNRPDNLVVSCNSCNRARGAMLPFIERMQPAAHALFLTLVSQRIGINNSLRVSEAGTGGLCVLSDVAH